MAARACKLLCFSLWLLAQTLAAPSAIYRHSESIECFEAKSRTCVHYTTQLVRRCNKSCHIVGVNCDFVNYVRYLLFVVEIWLNGFELTVDKLYFQQMLLSFFLYESIKLWTFNETHVKLKLNKFIFYLINLKFPKVSLRYRYEYSSVSSSDLS